MLVETKFGIHNFFIIFYRTVQVIVNGYHRHGATSEGALAITEKWDHMTSTTFGLKKESKLVQLVKSSKVTYIKRILELRTYSFFLTSVKMF